MRRDVDTVLVQARWDAARDDLRVERSQGQSISARDTVQPGEPGHGDAAVQRLEPRKVVWRREGRMLQPPTQVLDAELAVHRLVGGDDLLDGCAARRGAGLRVLVAPACLGDQAL